MLRQQLQGVWHMLGRETGELPGYGGPGEVHPSDRAAITLADCTLGVIALGASARNALDAAWRSACASLRSIPAPPSAPQGVTLQRPDRLNDVLGESDFVVIAAPHTPETYKLFNRDRIRKMKRSAYLINVGRGVIVDLAGLTAALQAKEIAGAGFRRLRNGATAARPSVYGKWKT
jgi:phosphoglycerate dehydrogenase-like enzyme